MDNKTIIILAALAVVLIAVLFSGNVRTKIGNWFSLGTRSNSRNEADVKGEGHDVTQRTKKDKNGGATINNLNIEGKNNKVVQEGN